MSILSKALKQLVGAPEINLSGLARLTGLEDKAAYEVVKQLKMSAGDMRRIASLLVRCADEKDARDTANERPA